jgi:hypothetical protein
MVFTGLSSNLMPTNTKQNGGLIFLTYLPHGSISVLKAFLFRVMSLTLSFDPRPPLNSQRLIRLPLLSAPSTSIVNVLPHFSKPSQTHILTGKFGQPSYREEKQGIESLDTYCKIALGEYCALCKKGAPKAIPTMCVLTIKKDEQLLPLQAKSWIVALGNLEERFWSKSNRFAPALCQDSLCFLTSLAVEKHRALQQGNCKNAFCHGILPPEETTIVCPPAGDPDAEPQEYWLLLKTLYSLRRSPCHWYDKINAILISIGLTPSLEDPCLYSGLIQDPSDPLSGKSSSPLTLGLYVDDFVYFSEDPAVDALFCHLLGGRCKVDFMGVIEWFLGIHFAWCITSNSVSVHLNQSGFAANLVESFFQDSRNVTPTATPYRSGVPIDSIAPSTDDNNSQAQL